MATTQIINVAQANRGPGTFTFDGPQPVPSGLRFATFEILLADADKLAAKDSKSLDIQFFFSPDGIQPYVFVNGTTWKSYGPGGLTVRDPDGTVRVNPNPLIRVSLLTRAGQRIRGSITLAQQFFAGVIISTTS